MYINYTFLELDQRKVVIFISNYYISYILNAWHFASERLKCANKYFYWELTCSLQIVGGDCYLVVGDKIFGTQNLRKRGA